MPIRYEDAKLLKDINENREDLTLYPTYWNNREQLNNEYQIDCYLAVIDKAQYELGKVLQRIEDEAIDDELDMCE